MVEVHFSQFIKRNIQPGKWWTISAITAIQFFPLPAFVGQTYGISVTDQQLINNQIPQSISRMDSAILNNKKALISSSSLIVASHWYVMMVVLSAFEHLWLFLILQICLPPTSLLSKLWTDSLEIWVLICGILNQCCVWHHPWHIT